ncbi:hypothetical protein PsYK624_047790 [Phanerochaete sordida]|uniref:Uncharacterized protein n=1 Tax=Phanerochaete sordida TaxID=48140 RepID=A0A9P3G5N6_9APHY|nr:hypothetical protein PsYK624_047790 [Phanerochaete sordida]
MEDAVAARPRFIDVLACLLTGSLAGRYRSRLQTLGNTRPADERLPNVLGEFGSMYHRELQVSLTCTVSVFLMATETQTFKCPLKGGERIHESLRYPVPKILWTLSLIYATLGILLSFSALQLPGNVRMPARSAEAWRQRLLHERGLHVKLAAPHAFSAWSVVLFVAYLYACMLPPTSSDEPDLLPLEYGSLSGSLAFGVIVVVPASVIAMVSCARTFRRLSSLAQDI